MTLRALAETLSADFAQAVAAEERAEALALHDVALRLRDAEQRRRADLGQEKLRREEAARIIAESLRAEERIEASWRDALVQIEASLGQLQGARLGAQPTAFKVLAGGREGA